MRFTLLPIAVGILAGGCSSPSSVNDRHGDNAASLSRAAEAPRINPVLQWNRVLLKIVRTPGAQPATVHPTRSFTMMHAAIYDAVNAIDATHAPYAVRLHDVPRDASEDAAAAAAAHDVLVALYPSFRPQFDEQLQESLAAIDDRAGKENGITVGQTVAARIVTLRADDGSSATPPHFTLGVTPGGYQSTPPNFPAQPQFTHWSRVRPFALKRANEFRPGPPPALASDRYADDLNEVKALGRANDTLATADQRLTGRFWNGAIRTYWSAIAQTTSSARHLATAENARLFALLNLTLADVVIGLYDAKYTYSLWRPVTAIRAADTDGNPETIADSAWLPLVGNTTPDPSYPGAHAAISAAALEILHEVFAADKLSFSVTSEALPGAERSFGSLSAAAREATLSRIFAGVHFRFDLTAGETLGRQVGGFVTHHFLTPRRGGSEAGAKHRDRSGNAV